MILDICIANETQLIELWETYLMQLDREEDEQTIFRPASESAST